MGYSRYREIVNPTLVGAHTNYVNGSPGGASFQLDVKRFSSNISDVVTPGYRRQISDGAIINNACSMHVDLQEVQGNGYYKGIRHSTGTVYEVYGSGSVTAWLQYYTGFTYLNSPSINGSPLDVIAKNKSISYIDNSPYEFAEDIGELRETVRFLKNPAKSLLKFSKSFNRDVLKHMLKNGRRIRSFASASADLWLEYRFAAIPTVRSMVSIAEAYHDTDIKYPKRRSGRGFQKKQNAGSSGLYDQYWGGPTVHFYVKDEQWVSYRAAILYQVGNPVIDFRYKYGLRAQDIPETAWNLLPLSFMVDRVVDISSMIRGVTNLLLPNLEILAGCIVEKKHLERFITAASISDGGWGTITLTPDTVRTKTFLYERTVWSPGLADTVPPLNLQGLYSDSTRVADLLALSYKLLTGRHT